RVEEELSQRKDRAEEEEKKDKKENEL
ncbi:unnamed protein product, partial [Allacma fusca]